MEPEKLVPKFETCKKLKKLKWNQETYFCYVAFVESDNYKLETNPSLYTNNSMYYQVPAPTTSEIMEELPPVIDGLILIVTKILHNNKIFYQVEYAIPYHDEWLKGSEFTHEIPAQALAELWIWWRGKLN